MPKISKRGQIMPPSPIRKLVPFADAAKERGIEVLHLNIGQPDIPTPQPMLDTMRNLDITTLEYSASNGMLAYRKKLTEYYRTVDVKVNAQQIIVTTGGSEAIMFTMMACLDPGDEIIIPEPYYANYNGFATESEIVVKTVRSYIESGFALPPIDKIEAQITDKTKAIMICNPNNPTGYLYTREELEKLRDICIKNDIYIFSDEAYREFCYDGRKHISVLSLDGLEQNAVLLDTISKRYSACGARIGCVVSKNPELMDSIMKFAQARLSPPTIEQYMGITAVELPKDYYDEVITEYQSRRDTLIAGLENIEGVKCTKPSGAFYVLIELPVDDADKFCQWMLEDFDLDGTTVMMAPSSGFYSNPEYGKKQVRLAYVLDEPEIEVAVEVLKAGLEKYKS